MRKKCFLLFTLVLSVACNAFAQSRSTTRQRGIGFDPQPNFQQLEIREISEFRPPTQRTRFISKIWVREGKRIPQPFAHFSDPETQDIASGMFWFTESNTYVISTWSYPQGNTYLVIRYSEDGIDAYGFGKELLSRFKREGYGIKFRGEIDFNLPYVIHMAGDTYELETFREARWVEMLFDAVNVSIQNIVIPKMNGLDPKPIPTSAYNLRFSLTFEPPKDFRWLDKNGKVIKPDLSSQRSAMKAEVKAQQRIATDLAKKERLKNKTSSTDSLAVVNK